MIGRLLCWLGFHRWGQARDPLGHVHTYCERCHERTGAVS